MKAKQNHFVRKKVALAVMTLGFLFVAAPIKVQAAEADIAARIEALKTKFPQGKYWNHVGSLTDNEDGWTDTPCTCHGVTGVSHVYGTGGCTCNHHTDSGHFLATQCMGFANKLGYDVFGATTWTKYNNPTAAQKANIKIGDIIRMDNDSHSVFVIARSGNQITVGEANYSGRCQISWSRTIDLTTASITNYEHAANYDSITGTGLVGTGNGESSNGGSVSQPSDSTAGGAASQPSDSAGGNTASQPSDAAGTGTPDVDGQTKDTGWKQAEDGVHYYYVENGVILKEKWLTLSKKKYYLDQNGYRVTGLYSIGKSTYYFDNDGVGQTEKWVDFNKESYYVCKTGEVLKSQWLYKNNVLVYVKGDGAVAKSELVTIGSNTYYFNKNGKRSKGFKKYNGKYYYCDKKGIIQKKKWVTKGGKKYYLQKNGVRAQEKLVKIGKYRYYFSSSGQMVKRKKVIYKGKQYKADKYGHCKFVRNVES